MPFRPQIHLKLISHLEMKFNFTFINYWKREDTGSDDEDQNRSFKNRKQVQDHWKQIKFYSKKKK